MMATADARRERITKRVVDAAAPSAERYTIWDIELKGFGLRVAPSGTKTFIIRYRTGGGRRGTLRQAVIGRYGPMTPETARKKAKRELGAVTGGDDPQAERARKRAELTVSELCDLYMAEGTALKKESTLYIDKTRIARHIKPLIGAQKVSEVVPADIERLMRSVANGKTKHADAPLVRGGKAAAARTVGLLSGIFAFAVAEGMRPDNPAKSIDRYKDVKRDRFLSPAEIGKIGDALRGMGAEGVDWRPLTIVRLLMLTGARKNEIVRLRWNEVETDRGLLRLQDSKTGAKVIPLGAAALEVLNGMERPKGGVYVFPDSDGAGGPYRGFDWAWVGIRTRAGLPDLRVHDLRHSFASAGLAAGQALPLIGKILGHSQISTTGRYAHLADDPVKAAADRIASAVDGAMRHAPAPVKSLRKKNPR